ncbi:MAG: hypothetical protein DMG56_25665, partial [Acidobacteria bacterium]
MRIQEGTLERSLGRQLLAHSEYLSNRHFLSRVFLNYFCLGYPCFAMLRPVFACPYGQWPAFAPRISTNAGVVLGLP